MKYDSKNAQYECSIVRKYEYCQFFSNLADFDNFCFLNEMVSIWTRVQCGCGRLLFSTFLVHSYNVNDFCLVPLLTLRSSFSFIQFFLRFFITFFSKTMKLLFSQNEFFIQQFLEKKYFHVYIFQEWITGFYSRARYIIDIIRYPLTLAFFLVCFSV